MPIVEPARPSVASTGRVLAAGELLWDLLPAGPRLGGTTSNFTIASAQLGRPAALISRLGPDQRGARARSTLAELQRRIAPGLLDLSLLQAAPATPTGIVEVTVSPHGQPAYAIRSPSAWDEILPEPAALAAAHQASAFCFGTLAQRSEPSRSSIRTLLQHTPASCLRVLDMNVRLPFFSSEVADWSLAHATLAKISDEELEIVAQALGFSAPFCASDIARMEQTAHSLLGRYPGLHLVALTLGSRGSLLISRSDRHHHHGFPIQVADTVGAGDAFTAGLVHAQLAGASLEASNEISNLCGSFVASQPGATPAFPPALLERIAAALAASAPTPPRPHTAAG